jgi:hypothetical protein
MNLSPDDFVSLLTSSAITKGVVLTVRDEGYFVTVQWITRPFMEGKVTTHREADLYKLAYRPRQPSPERSETGRLGTQAGPP